MQLNVDEKRAVNTASPVIGEWLDALGKTDLAQMTEGEWLSFLAHVYASVCAEVCKVWENEVPF
ncbi:MAG: hypothetical protein RL268_2352 [Pseudomonadota bacterium]